MPTAIAVAALIVGWLQYRLSVREARRARSNQRESHATGYVIAIIFGLVAGALFYRKLTESTPDTTSAATATGAAVCPSQAEFRSAPKSFVVVEMPPNDTAMVLQFVARQDTGKREIVVSLCRDSSSGYWYFSHYRDDDATGLVTSATSTDDGFTAANHATNYQYSAEGGSARGGGVDLRLVFDDILCAEQDELAQRFVEEDPGPCTGDEVDTWTP